jgi:L-fuculokinase
MEKMILILDCGATNVKACLVDTTGHIIESHSLPNQTVADPHYTGGLIWDIDDIWNKLAICCQKVCSAAENAEIIAITVTTFGVDGTAVMKDGTLCYPVISWQCQRTEKVEKNIHKYFDPEWLYQTTGLQSYHFNTINKLIWLKENRPDVLRKMDYYVLMPSLILYRLTGQFITDTTMAGTSMLTELRKRSFSTEILNKLGLDSSIFPPMAEPGTVFGQITKEAAEKMGIKPGLAVIAAGHDTQFAILGSGAGVNQPVLSSGTWEILMVRASAEFLQVPSKDSGVTIELDALPGLVNIGVQWVASGVLEWISRLLYPDISARSSSYSTIINEAANIPAGSNGVMIVPELFPGGISGKQGNIGGLTHETTRAHIYRACLEALSYYTYYGLDKLQLASNYKAKSIICVGGGSKNPLWNQIRSDVIGVPVKTLDMKETTALGAAMVAFTGMKIYKSIEEAFSAMEGSFVEYKPGKDFARYQEMYRVFAESVFSQE